MNYQHIAKQLFVFKYCEFNYLNKVQKQGGLSILRAKNICFAWNILPVHYGNTYT